MEIDILDILRTSLPADVLWGSFVTRWMRDKRTPKDVCGEATSEQEKKKNFIKSLGFVHWQKCIGALARRSQLATEIYWTWEPKPRKAAFSQPWRIQSELLKKIIEIHHKKTFPYFEKKNILTQ